MITGVGIQWKGAPSLTRIFVIALIAMVVVGALVFGLTSLGILPAEFSAAMGKMLGDIPIVGAWIDGIYSLPSMIRGNDLIVSTARSALQILLRSLSSNIMDSLFLGLVCALVGIILDTLFAAASPQTQNTVSIVSLVTGTILGVLALWFTKGGSGSQQFIYEIFSIAIMIAGILIMIRRFNVGGTILSFLFKTVADGIAAGCTVGFFTSMVMLVFLVQSGLPALAIVLWVVMVLLFFLAGFAITYAVHQSQKENYVLSGSMGPIITIGVLLLIATIVIHFIT